MSASGSCYFAPTKTVTQSVNLVGSFRDHVPNYSWCTVRHQQQMSQMQQKYSCQWCPTESNGPDCFWGKTDDLPKRRMRDPTREELQLKKKKWKSEAAFAPLALWSPSSSRHWYTHACTHKGTQALSLSLCCISVSLYLFFLFHLLHIPSSLPLVCSRDPPVPQYLPLVCCPGFDICLQKDQQHTLDPFLQLPRL